MGKPSLYVVVRASYKEYEADLARVRGIARTQGEEISKVLNNAITPNQAIKGFESLSVNIQKAVGAANAFNVKPQIKGLEEMARLTGVSTARMNDLSQAMLKTARENALETAFKKIEKQTNMSALGMAKLRYEMGDTVGAIKTLGRAAVPVVGTIAAVSAGLLYMGKSALDAQLALQRLEVAYASVFGNSARTQLNFIYEQTQKVGLEFRSTAEAAKSFFAAGQDTTIAPELNNIFSAISNAAGALQLGEEQVKRTFVALGQVLSKGKVQAEELRGQLGEQLPGAFQLAAKAMGMTTSELDKFMADGKLLAEDLLPKMADALNEKYARAAEEAGNKAQASINRMTTEWELFKASVIDSEAVISVLNRVTSALKARNDAEAASKENASLGNQLAGMGIAPDVISYDFDGAGNRMETRSYSNDLLNWMRNLNAGIAAESQITEQRLKTEAKIIADGRKALDDALKNTKDGRLSALKEDHEKQLSKIDELISLYEQQGTATTDLVAKRAAVVAAYGDEVEKILNKGSGAATRAEKAQNAYTAAVEATRAEIAGYQQQLALDSTEDLARAKIKIESEYQQAVAKTTKEIANQVASKALSSSEAQNLTALKMQSLELEKQVKFRDAEEKARDREIQMVGDQLNFMKELADMSGNYGGTIELQNRLIDLQAKKYREILKIPPQLVDEWEKLAKLQASIDPFDGAYRGLLRFTAEYNNEAKQWENITYTWATGFNDTTKDMWGDFLDTGKVSFDQLSLSFTKLLKDMSYQALVQPVVLSIVGMARDSIYSATSAGQSGGGAIGASSGNGLVDAGMGMAQQYGISQLMNGAGSSGMFSGLVNGLNSGAAYLFPSTFAPTSAIAAGNASVAGVHSAMGLSAPTGLGGTQTLSGAWGAAAPTMMGAGMGAGVGGMVSPYLNNALGLGTGQNASTGAMVGGLGATAVLGTLALANMWNPGGWIAGGIAGLSALLGGGIGGAFGSWNDEPGLWAAATVDLSKRNSGQQMEDMHHDRKHPWSWYTHADDTGYLIQSRHRDGMSQAAAQQATDYLEQVARQGLALSDQIATALGGVTGGLADAYKNSLGLDSTLFIGRDWEGKTPDIEGLGSEIFSAMKGKISGALQRMDISSLSIAADGMLADTTDEIMTSISKSMQFFNVGESLGDYSGEFTQAVSGKVLDMLNSMDTSGIRLNIDKSSLAGWGVASQAVTAWNEIDAALESILRPTSELDAALGTATTQFDGWLESLKALGWQQEALAEIEKERLAYLEQYESALTRSAEQNLYLRGLALSAGTDSLAYQQQSLKYQQENELADYAKKYGSEAGLLAAKAAKLNADAYQGKTDWDSNKVYEGIKAAGMTVAQWLERHGRSEGFNQNISLHNQLMYTQQAESIQAEIDYLQKQYNSMLQEQISSAQSLVNSFDRVVDSLDKARRNLWSSDANISTSRLADARADFSTVYAKAMAGDVDAMAELPSISTNLLNLGKEQIASRDVYQDLFYDVDRKLKDAQGIAKNQYDTNKLQLDTLQSQLSTQQKSYLTLAEISAKITALSGDLAAAMAKAAKTPLAQTESLLQSKADLLNQQAYQGRTDWTAQSVQSGILSAGMTVDQWYQRHGINEGVSSSYTSTSSGKSDAELLAEKAASLNASGYGGKSDWTASSVAQGMSDLGMTVSQWYDRHGKAEGFATGGITPANQPFWVGENGPELVVSPQQWGVINNTDSMALMRGMSGGGSINSGAIVAAINNMNDTLRQLLTKTDRIMADQGRIRDRMDMFAQEGVTIAAA